MADISRAGHWKHEWIPLDLVAAREKNHGREPKNWHAPGAVEVSHHHDGQPGDHRDASWIKSSNWNDSKDSTTGYRRADLGKIADFSGTVRERHASGTNWKSGAKQYDWQVFRQRTDREGTDARGSHWSGNYATGTEETMQKAKSAASGAMKKHRAQHLAGGGDVGYGEPLPRGATRALAHEPLGKPGGPGLFHHKGMQLPAFVQHIAKDLMESRGMPESEAIAMAVAQCKKWAAGGQDVKPETRAKAAAAVAEWERLKAGTHATRKDGGMSRTELFRSYPLEDYHIVRTGEGDSSGRVVEAYMTVFDEEAEIYDGQGRYREAIDRAAFNKRIADLERSRNGFAAAKVFYNHGMTIHGTPSDRYSMPTAVCEGIRADTRGPVTRSRYLDTPLGNEVLEMWRSGAVTAQSFTGAIIRSSPELKSGEKYRPRNGQLPQVRRLELGLKEYGPTPFPAYTGAELVGVRMSPLGTWQAADDDEVEELDDEALPPDGEAAPGGPPDVHPSRDHAHRLYALRTEQMLRDAGIASLKGGW
jgi:phage head maturation protease